VSIVLGQGRGDGGEKCKGDVMARWGNARKGKKEIRGQGDTGKGKKSKWVGERS